MDANENCARKVGVFNEIPRLKLNEGRQSVTSSTRRLTIKTLVGFSEQTRKLEWEDWLHWTSREETSSHGEELVVVGLVTQV